MLARKYCCLFVGIVLITSGGWIVLRADAGGDAMTKAANTFLKSLNDEQRAKAAVGFDSPSRVGWHFIPKTERKGLQIREMDAAQRKAAHALLQASLSQAGYETAVEIMELEQILNKLEGKRARFRRDNLRYYFTVFGRPSKDGKWGLSIEGHHLSLNFVVNQGQVVSHTPHFLGANPAVVKGDYGVGPKKGTQTLAKEETLAFKLFNSLDDEQKRVTLIAEKAPRDLRGGGEAQPPGTSPEGLPASKLSKSQQQQLVALLKVYTDKMAAETGKQRLAEIKAAGIEKIHFAWAGAAQPGVGHYYRIQGPTFLVELCNTQPDPAGNPANHVHCMWRNTAGDFGIAR